MEATTITVQQAIQNAAEALRRGDRRSARHWAQIAASSSPTLEEPWLILAAVSSPHAAIEYLKQALLANPGSERAMRGLRWAQDRLAAQPARPAPVSMAATQPVLAATQPVQVRRQAAPAPSKKQRHIVRWLSVPALVLTLLCILVAWAAWPGSSSSALALIRSEAGPNSSGAAWSQAQIAKPSNTPAPSATTPASATPLPSLTPTLTPFPPVTSTASATALPTDSPTDLPTALPTDSAPAANVPVVGSYTIRSGDTLFSIASRAGLTANQLAAANQISVYATIYAGQVLNIPQGGTVPDPAAQPTQGQTARPRWEANTSWSPFPNSTCMPTKAVRSSIVLWPPRA